MPSITVTEIFKYVLRLRGEESALVIVAHMTLGNVISLDTQLAIDAAAIGVELELPLTDSIIFATAQKYNATLWTQDADFEGLPNVKFYSKSKA